MEPGKIRPINSGGQSDAGFTQTIAVSVGNSVFDLDAGRSVDVLGSTLSVVALDTLQLFGTDDTI
jgi:mRNA degradation ribonuclease J1/J2